MAGLRVVEAQPVEQHERLAEAGAADGEVALHAVGRAGAQVERGIEPQEAGDGGRERALVFLERDDAHGAVGLFERNGLISAGDHHHVAPRRSLLGEQRQRECEKQQAFIHAWGRVLPPGARPTGGRKAA